MYPRISLQPGREKSVQFGHPWLFSRALQPVSADITNGSLVTVVDSSRAVLGTGYYNGQSQISVRFFVFGEEQKIDEQFFVEAFTRAQQQRERFLDLTQTNAYRLVFSESDDLPGLIVDRYGDFLVMQMHTLGMDKLRDLIVGALQKVFQPQGIYERSDVDVRRKEGLRTMPQQLLAGAEPPEFYEIFEHGLKFYVDMKHGQKTGFFLDQRENRKAIEAYSKGKTVLNLFGYSGGFSLAALRGGARQTTTVDIAENALELARKNFELNGFDPAAHEFVATDAFRYLDECVSQKRRFDLIIVDPPAFVKSKDNLNAAVNAYIRLNAKALKLVAPGGILAASSCSSHVSQELFRTILFKAALESQSDLVMLDSRIQPLDHPLRLNFPEGEYLKFCLCLKK